MAVKKVEVVGAPWKTIATFDNFEDANVARQQFLDAGQFDCKVSSQASGFIVKVRPRKIQPVAQEVLETVDEVVEKKVRLANPKQAARAASKNRKK